VAATTSFSAAEARPANDRAAAKAVVSRVFFMVFLILDLSHHGWRIRVPNRFTGGREADDTEIFYSVTISFN
jgi:hypothetical protein